MERTCPISGEVFEITEADQAFYHRMSVPAPRLAPPERQRRRICYRNFRNLYTRSCSGTGSRIVSMYDANVPFPVYSLDYWWSDGWDARSFGREFDFSRSFFEQYRELAVEVPRSAVMNTNCENCHYSNFAVESRNCYLVFGCVKDEDCLYGHIVWESENCVDCLYAYQCRWCSNSADLVACYNVHYSTECVNCRESLFLHDCRNCHDCFGCTNLRGESYCLFNERLTEGQYKEKIAGLVPLTADKVKRINAWVERQKREGLYPPLFANQVEDVSGNHLFQCQNLGCCFDAKNSQDAKFCFTVFDVHDAYDLSFGSGRFAVESVAAINSEQIRFCHTVANCSNAAYCEFCYSSHDVFGCMGLRRSEYCILNRQYTREDYHRLVEKITAHMRQTGEWGSFFPASDSPFAYNESIAQEYMPLTKDEILARGLKWKEPYPVQETEEGSVLPENDDSKHPENVVGRVLRCEKSGKAYRILQSEFEFYQRMSLPLPRVCPDVRHTRRMRTRQERRIWRRCCPCCGCSFESAFNPAGAEAVLCEGCYQKGPACSL